MEQENVEIPDINENEAVAAGAVVEEALLHPEDTIAKVVEQVETQSQAPSRAETQETQESLPFAIDEDALTPSLSSFISDLRNLREQAVASINLDPNAFIHGAYDRFVSLLNNPGVVGVVAPLVLSNIEILPQQVPINLTTFLTLIPNIPGSNGLIAFCNSHPQLMGTLITATAGSLSAIMLIEEPQQVTERLINIILNIHRRLHIPIRLIITVVITCYRCMGRTRILVNNIITEVNKQLNEEEKILIEEGVQGEVPAPPALGQEAPKEAGVKRKKGGKGTKRNRRTKKNKKTTKRRTYKRKPTKRRTNRARK